jgi:hypothetical protein
MRLQDEPARGRQRRVFKRLIFAAVLLFAAATACAGLFGTVPRDLKIPGYKPVKIPFHPGQSLTFRVAWAGIPAAGATIDLHENPDNPELWTGEARVATNDLVDLLFKMRDYMRENFARRSLAPRDIYIKQFENQRLHEYLINFDSGSGMVRMVKRHKQKSEKVEFHSPNPMGPISGSLMALSQPLEVGQTLVFDVFAGHNRYVVALKVERRERVRVTLGDFDALRITPTILYVSDAEVRSKAREATIWVSADERHLPLRAQAAAFVGYITADLVQVDDSNAEGQNDSVPRPKPAD